MNFQMAAFEAVKETPWLLNGIVIAFSSTFYTSGDNAGQTKAEIDLREADGGTKRVFFSFDGKLPEGMFAPVQEPGSRAFRTLAMVIITGVPYLVVFSEKRLSGLSPKSV